MNIYKIISFFFNADEFLAKTCDFLFFDLQACNKKAEILPLATTLITHVRGQFIHVFALLISMPRFKSINFCQNRPKIKILLQKNCKISDRIAPGSQIAPLLQICG